MDRAYVFVADDGSEETREEMMTMIRAVSAREPFWEAVTVVLPIVSGEDDATVEQLRERYGSVFAVLGLDARSDRDLALITGAVETAKWVLMSSELAGVDPEVSWQSYLAQMRGVA